MSLYIQLYTVYVLSFIINKFHFISFQLNIPISVFVGLCQQLKVERKKWPTSSNFQCTWRSGSPPGQKSKKSEGSCPRNSENWRNKEFRYVIPLTWNMSPFLSWFIYLLKENFKRSLNEQRLSLKQEFGRWFLDRRTFFHLRFLRNLILLQII